MVIPNDGLIVLLIHYYLNFFIVMEVMHDYLRVVRVLGPLDEPSG